LLDQRISELGDADVADDDIAVECEKVLQAGRKKLTELVRDFSVFSLFENAFQIISLCVFVLQ
jgi:hypothetical protein